jgi:hypothetical protein
MKNADPESLRRRAAYLALREQQARARAARLRGELGVTLGMLARLGVGAPPRMGAGSIIPFPRSRRRRR